MFTDRIVFSQLMDFIRITEGKTHDVNVLDELVLDPGAFYIMDYGRRSYRKVDKRTGLRSDQTIFLS